MAARAEVRPSAEFRFQVKQRGGSSVGRCYQCATCSSVCELAPAEAPFPRRQMLWAQWGLADRVAGDPGVWLCHQCNDCSVRCPRDARPGDVVQVLRSMAVEHLAFPRFLGRLVGRAGSTWPILLAVPLLFWIGVLLAVNGFAIPSVEPGLSFVQGQFYYDALVPHWLIYAVFFPIAGWVTLAAVVSGSRLWRLMGEGATRRGSFLANVIPAMRDIGTHKRFGDCGEASGRRWGHFWTLWGFVGAAVTSGLLVVYLYGFHMYPLSLVHWVKWLGNISAVILVVGGVMLVTNRLRGELRVGSTGAFDRFFLGVVAAVITTGVLTEVARFVLPPIVASGLYVMHLSVVMTLFVTFPYSKFAHLIYRTLAMVHQRMVDDAPQQ